MSAAAQYGNPVNVLREGAFEEKGHRAKLGNIIGATAVADLVKSTLGPKGMDKILQGQDGEVTVTNDGATILSKILVDNPAAKILVDVSKGQDAEVGDGTTTVCVLCGELLHEAEKLLEMKIHPQTIIDGYRAASKVALEAFLGGCFTNADDATRFREDLLNIARTTLSSKVLYVAKDHFAKLTVDAVMRIQGSTDLEAIHIIKKPGGGLRDSYVDDGFLLDKKIGVGQPRLFEKNVKVLVCNTALDTDKIKIYGARVRSQTYAGVAEIEEAERSRMRAKVERMIATGANVIINRQLIYNYPEQLFAERGIMAIEHADFDGIERLALALGADIVSTFDTESDSGFSAIRLGECDRVEEVMIGEDRLIRFSGLKAGAAAACTVVLRGASSHVLDEAERSLHDALAVVSQTVANRLTCYGGGCPEMRMALAVDNAALKTAGKKQLAIEAFARALRSVVGVIAENGGYDAADLVAQLRAAHIEGNAHAGLDMNRGAVGDMAAMGVVECAKVKKHAVQAAAEAAEMILRVDDILRAAPRQRQHE
nr:T-complex protein 1 subunit beta [Andalucia godoyi]|eukprot:ANDGO_07094.mRNA.1 T-complex protein 1 subunit beta